MFTFSKAGNLATETNLVEDLLLAQGFTEVTKDLCEPKAYRRHLRIVENEWWSALMGSYPEVSPLFLPHSIFVKDKDGVTEYVNLHSATSMDDILFGNYADALKEDAVTSADYIMYLRMGEKRQAIKFIRLGAFREQLAESGDSNVIAFFEKLPARPHPYYSGAKSVTRENV